MKTKLVVLLVALSFSISGIMAQNRQQVNPEEMAKRQTERLTERLKLTDDQKEKVQAVTLKYAKERTTQMSNSSDTDREKRREAFQELQKKQDEELNAIFTEDQQKEYEKYRKETPQRTGNRGDNNRRSR